MLDDGGLVSLFAVVELCQYSLVSPSGDDVIRTIREVPVAWADRYFTVLACLGVRGSVDKIFRSFIALDLQILDDLGLRRFDHQQSIDLYELVIARDHTASFVITPKRDIEEWLGLFDALILAYSTAALTAAVVTTASSLRGDRFGSKVLARKEGTGADLFEIGALAAAPEELAADLEWGWIELSRGGTGITVLMPECSPAAIGWLIASAFEAALSLEPAPQTLSVRVTREDQP